MKMKSSYLVKRKFAKGLALMLVLLYLIAATVFAYVDTSPVAVTVADAAYNVLADGDACFVEPTNSFTDGVIAYYLVTQNPDRQLLTQITHAGQTIDLTAVLYTDTGDLSNLKISGQSYGIFDYRSATQNMSFFFDGGEYWDTNYANYTSLSKANMSLIGLEANVVFKKAAYPTSAAVAAQDCVERYNLAAPNIYLENIIFDGNGKDLLPLGGGSSGVGKNRGEFAFFLTTNTDGFVMKNCSIRNYGKDLNQPGSIFRSDLIRKNVAINFYRNTGSCTVDGLVVESIKTKSGFGMVSLNQAKDIYFRDISLNAAAAHPQSYSIKMETMSKSTAALPIDANSAVFASPLTLSQDPYHSAIYVEDYRYKSLHAPEEYRFTAYRAENGTNFDYNSLTFETLPDPSIGNLGIHAILDNRDQCWVVREGLTTTVSAQISKVLEVCAKLNAGGVHVPPPNIKLIPVDSVDSFDVAYASPLGVPVHIMAMQGIDSPLTDLLDPQRMIPVTADAVIQLNLNDGDKAALRLHNMNFHDLAKYTMQAAVSGITVLGALSDPNEGGAVSGYPTYSSYFQAASSRVVGSTPDSFENCRFTTLTAEILIIDKPAEAPTLYAGDTMALGASLSAGANSSSGNLIAAPNDSADDKSIRWFSTDTAVATVDSQTGVVTAVSEGTVRIYAKAIDSNNGGEIEKPWDSIEIKIGAQAQKLPYTVKYYLDGAYQAEADYRATVEPSSPQVNAVPDKKPAGFSFDSLSSTALPFTVTAEDNVIHIYYVTDSGATEAPEGLPFIIEYYLDGHHMMGADITGTVPEDNPYVLGVPDNCPPNAYFDAANSTVFPFQVTAEANRVLVFYLSRISETTTAAAVVPYPTSPSTWETRSETKPYTPYPSRPANWPTDKFYPPVPSWTVQPTFPLVTQPWPISSAKLTMSAATQTWTPATSAAPATAVAQRVDGRSPVPKTGEPPLAVLGYALLLFSAFALMIREKMR